MASAPSTPTQGCSSTSPTGAPPSFVVPSCVDNRPYDIYIGASFGSSHAIRDVCEVGL